MTSVSRGDGMHDGSAETRALVAAGPRRCRRLGQSVKAERASEEVSSRWVEAKGLEPSNLLTASQGRPSNHRSPIPLDLLLPASFPGLGRRTRSARRPNGGTIDGIPD